MRRLSFCRKVKCFCQGKNVKCGSVTLHSLCLEVTLQYFQVTSSHFIIQYKRGKIALLPSGSVTLHPERGALHPRSCLDVTSLMLSAYIIARLFPINVQLPAVQNRTFGRAHLGQGDCLARRSAAEEVKFCGKRQARSLSTSPQNEGKPRLKKTILRRNRVPPQRATLRSAF